MRKLNWDDPEVCIVLPVTMWTKISWEDCVSGCALKGCVSSKTRTLLGVMCNCLSSFLCIYNITKLVAVLCIQCLAGVNRQEENSWEYPVHISMHRETLGSL